MNFANLILLSLIQGITEFLPVSSSAHLLLFPVLFHLVDQGPVADVCAHLGSLLAVVWFYRRDVVQIVASLFRKKADRHLFWSLFIATLPIVVVGLVAFLCGVDFRNPRIVIYTSIIFGILFFVADVCGRKRLVMKDFSLKNALFVGIAQVLSIIPGVSRSGVTTTCALALGYKRSDALKFSFLLAIPTIILACGGAGVKFILNPQPVALSSLGLITVFSFVFSFATINFMMFWLRHASFKIFALYRIGLGIFLYLYLK